jgi:lipoic acid synthetase
MTSSENNSEFVNRKPEWLKRKISLSGRQKSVHESIHSSGLHTVCMEAKCPNKGECYAKGTATFLIMGSVCSRYCTFCSVSHGLPENLDLNEHQKIIDAITKLKLKHVVITSVTRDDLPDGGSSFYAELIQKIRAAVPKVTIEVLIPDFQGNKNAIETVILASPDIFNHNVETVPRLYKSIRPQAIYDRSLSVLKQAAQSGLIVKSGLMVGLGESTEEIKAVMDDLHKNGCSIVTIGQYLQPSKEQSPVEAFISPEQFEEYKEYGQKIGIPIVYAGPFIRSSYMAEEIFRDLQH